MVDSDLGPWGKFSLDEGDVAFVGAPASVDAASDDGVKIGLVVTLIRELVRDGLIDAKGGVQVEGNLLSNVSAAHSVSASNPKIEKMAVGAQDDLSLSFSGDVWGVEEWLSKAVTRRLIALTDRPQPELAREGI